MNNIPVQTVAPWPQKSLFSVSTLRLNQYGKTKKHIANSYGPSKDPVKIHQCIFLQLRSEPMCLTLIRKNGKTNILFNLATL